MDPVVRDAAARIRHIANGYWRGGIKATDPVERADIRTSLADARAALCIAQGVPIEDIDPASGCNLSRAAYERSRASWRWNATMHGLDDDGLSEFFARLHDEVFAYWAARRPQFTDGDDWLAGIHKPEPEEA